MNQNTAATNNMNESEPDIERDRRGNAVMTPYDEVLLEAVLGDIAPRPLRCYFCKMEIKPDEVLIPHDWAIVLVNVTPEREASIAIHEACANYGME